MGERRRWAISCQVDANEIRDQAVFDNLVCVIEPYVRLFVVWSVGRFGRFVGRSVGHNIINREVILPCALRLIKWHQVLRGAIGAERANFHIGIHTLLHPWMRTY